MRANSLPKIKKNDSVEVYEGDLRSSETVRGAMRGIQSVIHMAALLRNNPPGEIHKTNVEATRLLVEEALKNKVKKFIFVSTENALREDLEEAYARS